MVIKTASPGIVIQEVDLTKGTSDAITTNIGAFAGPFQRGPVDELVLIETEAQFQSMFGDPTDANYEYWYTVSNYLEYGGVCYVIRTDDSVGDSSGTFLQTLKNATDEIVTDPEDTLVYVKNQGDFEENWFQTASAPGKFIARNPGTWGNGIGVAVIDHGADYQISLKADSVIDILDGTDAGTDRFVNNLDSGALLGRYIRVSVPDIAPATLAAGDWVEAYDDGDTATGAVGVVIDVTGNDLLIASFTEDTEFAVGDNIASDGTGTIETLPISEIYLVGTYTLYGYNGTDRYSINAVLEPKTYTLSEGDDFGWTTTPTDNLKVVEGGPADYGDTYVWSNATSVWSAVISPKADDYLSDGTNLFAVSASDDWYTQQEAFAGLPWYRFAGRPGSTQNALGRGCSNDELNILVYDATGNLTGTKGNTLESYFGVSKLYGASTQEGDVNYYIDVMNRRSGYIYANQTLGLVAGNLNGDLQAVGTTISDGINCAYIEAKTYDLQYGVDNFTASLGELQAAYNKLTVENVTDLDYILQGPGLSTLDDSVAKANFLISVAEERKDCMVFVTPPRYAVVGQASSSTATAAILEWANELSSSSYTVIDSGYKYTYDRFNDQYRYLPLNGDVAGLMVNASVTAEPWYSPAGLSRGQVRNVVKLPYNPSKKQRDQLYTARVNPVVTFPGEGTILFGDKTALAYSSAFDRINVRKLFLVIEKEIAKMSRTTLFEFNDDITRSLFKNNVNPFLRDVQAKRGMYDFLVVCDETNNVPEVIDRNEFIADIYIKPTKSINFISLNFIATKTGISFDESIGQFRGSN